jgi:hypothetical protein
VNPHLLAMISHEPADDILFIGGTTWPELTFATDDRAKT